MRGCDAGVGVCVGPELGSTVVGPKLRLTRKEEFGTSKSGTVSGRNGGGKRWVCWRRLRDEGELARWWQRG